MNVEIEWIPVTERMPPVRTYVLAAWRDAHGPWVSAAMYDPDIIDTIDETGWWNVDDMSVLTRVTHWAHLPTHPDP